jgi:chaperonin GroES
LHIAGNSGKKGKANVNEILGTDIEQHTLPKLTGKLQFHSAVTLRPMFDRVLIRPMDTPKETESGIVIPDSVKPENKIRRGKVLAVGKGDRIKDGTHVKPFCRPGDTVLYTSNPNQDCEIDVGQGEMAECSIINEEQFLYAILD